LPTLSRLAGALRATAARVGEEHPRVSRSRVRRCAPLRATSRRADRCDTPAAPMHALALRGATGWRRDFTARADVDPVHASKSKPGTIPGPSIDSRRSRSGDRRSTTARHQSHVQLRVRCDAIVAAVSRRSGGIASLPVPLRRAFGSRSATSVCRRRARSRPADTIRRVGAARRSAYRCA
jgi:hypothetical protein